MKIKRMLLLLSGMLSCVLSFSAAASEVKPRPACHRLMTERECGDHKERLAALSPGAALDSYLAEYARTKREREAACNCARKLSGGEATARQRQALLRL